MAVVAEPFTAESPTLAVGLAKPENDPGKSDAAIVFQAIVPELTCVKNLLVAVLFTARA
jgi:hypothetical protein